MIKITLGVLSVLMGLFFLFGVLSPVPASGEPRGGGGKYDGFTSAIIRLVHTERIHPEGSKRDRTDEIPNGTAFFVKSGSDLFVVSARHVVEKEYDIHAKVRLRNKMTRRTKDFLLKLPKEKWVFHPAKGNNDTHYVDVAAMRIDHLMEYELLSFIYDPKAKSENDFLFSKPETHAPVLILGFCGNRELRGSRPKPSAKLGIVSKIKGNEFFKIGNGKFVEPEAYLVDADITQGNSGSPVFQSVSSGLLKNEMKIIGMVIGTNKPMDLAIVEPASRIGETIDFAKKKSVRGNGFWLRAANKRRGSLK